MNPLTHDTLAAMERLRADVANRDEFMLTCRPEKLADMFTAVRALLRLHPAEQKLPDGEELWWEWLTVVSKWSLREVLRDNGRFYWADDSGIEHECQPGRWVRCVAPPKPVEETV